MVLFKSESPIVDLIFGVLFCGFGFYTVGHRKKIVEASLSSSKIFWEKIGFFQGENIFRDVLTSFMIPLIGIIFATVGTLLIIRVVLHLFVK